MADETEDEAPALAPIAPMAPVPIGPQTTTSTGGDTSTYTSTRLSPQAVEAIGEQEAAGKSAADLNRQAGEATIEQKKAEAEGQGQVADLAQQQADEREARDKDIQDTIRRATEAHQADMETLGKQPFHGLFENESTGRKILRIAGMGLTGLSGNVEAQKAQFEHIDHLVQQDFDKQKAQHDAEYNKAQLSGKDIAEAYSNWEKGNAQLLARETVARQAVLERIKETLMRAGIPVGQLQNNANYQAALAQVQAAKAAALSRQVSSVATQKQLTPKTTVETGKVIPGAVGAGAAARELVGNAQSLADRPASETAFSAAERVLSGEGATLAQKAKAGVRGILSGGSPSVASPLDGLSDEDKEKAEQIIQTVKDRAAGSGRGAVNKDNLIAILHSSIPKEGDSPKAVEMKKRSLLNSVGVQEVPTKEGTKPATKATAAPRAESEFIDWAKANRGNPKAERILTANGIK